MNTISEQRCFGGTQGVYEHDSAATGTSMRFAVYTPPGDGKALLPTLWFLSGLTCTEQNFITKAGAQRYAAEHGMMLVVPDTSPRGAGVPGEDEASDLGTGAGFYLDATRAPWNRHYRMYTYVGEELRQLVVGRFRADPERQAISGHSMGGHGALVMALNNPDRYRSVSALAPIAAPAQVPWGRKAFSAYLGDDRDAWRRYDACELLRAGHRCAPIRVDQGEADAFVQEQLRPELLEAACAEAGQALELRREPGYDHSYYFVSSFIGEHIAFHAERIGASHS